MYAFGEHVPERHSQPSMPTQAGRVIIAHQNSKSQAAQGSTLAGCRLQVGAASILREAPASACHAGPHTAPAPSNGAASHCLSPLTSQWHCSGRITGMPALPLPLLPPLLLRRQGKLRALRCAYELNHRARYPDCRRDE